ncbi:hybrid non-ribosomal peptide synthetase/type I polyketide synthase [Sinorhizobium americanum]|uniref:Malonyl CoA-acyl carrier protein transacylase n=1 Tax=Sinorhizobium americanum TaxID=194963 RepID=A0A1L3LX77_9HYPH|nr:hybrid non-ribosomal peptide synthetase/type I polyketide synthase [Sinorhizobium americanum]APG94678.1 malonyl CoA-acyl carrier protein transacylase [Sinorhizobium americanum]OAP48713.1 non-ribosomal peptide synthetase [Sinorhizobium americanum]
MRAIGEADGDLSGVAIIGMSGRFPGAPSVEALWQMICEGRDAFSKLKPDELEDAFTDEERGSANYVPARPQLPDIELFDAEFFGMFPREAAVTDPQHRFFLEICWEALERAGYDPQRYPGLVGVFAGASMPTYLINNVLGERAKAEEFTSNYQIGCFQQIVGSLTDALATRIAYKFDLRGPAITIQSACSTSLLAVSQACQNLLTYSCDMALAGGVSITVPQRRGYFYQEGGMVSPDGICRPFDERAAGTVFGSGAAVVLLKRVEDALRDGDQIFAVIRGYGVNNDGSEKVGFTAPSVAGQAEAIGAALAGADVDPTTIGYVECHGTATPLGDPIEFAGLRTAFGDTGERRWPCALGSVKGTVGHLDAAAGVTGLIKAALALQHAKIPGLHNFTRPNPRIELDGSQFYIPTKMTDWPEGRGPRRAGVSSFGVGGTNVHVVVEEAPVHRAPEGDLARGPFILPLSARNEAALAAMRLNLRDHLQKMPDGALASVAHTLQTGRRVFAHRSAIVADSVGDAVERLGSERVASAVASDRPPIVFMFPGQGSQYVGMGAVLYEREPEFTRWIDRGTELLRASLKTDLRDFICHAGAVSQAMADEQRETRIAQPCLYLVEYALARLWMSRGLKPSAMIGHSVGEFVAATLANVISFEDGLRLVAARGRLMQAQPQGAMVSVRADVETVTTHLSDDVEIAAINAPKLCVISGTFAGVDATCATLEASGVAYSRLHTSHAFHSAMMDGVTDALREETAKVTYGTANLPYISCVSGSWQTGDQGTSPDYWARHCREAVRFSQGLETLSRDQKPVLLEVGPGRTLSVFAAQTLSRDATHAIVQSLPEHDRAHAASETLAEAHGKLWMAGCDLNWPEKPGAQPEKLLLPTYPFQRQRHWIDAPPSVRRAGDRAPAASAQTAETPASIVEATSTEGNPTMEVVKPVPAASRAPKLEASLLTVLADMSGEALGAGESTATFLELGLDSLFIGQFAQRIEKDYKIKLSFRELLSNIPTVRDLARHLDEQLPPEPETSTQPVVAEPATAAPITMPPPALSAPTAVFSAPTASVQPASASGLEGIMQSQLLMVQSILSQQLQVLQAGTAERSLSPAAPVVTTVQPMPVPELQPAPSTPEAARTVGDGDVGAQRIKLYSPGTKSAASEMTPEKQAFVTELIAAYGARNPKSKSFTDRNRRWLADPRTAAGFRQDWKEIVFPIVSDRSRASRIWDIDGNEYIDLVNGMGQTAFGHAPDFVAEAIKSQVDAGFAIGPQTPLAGEVAELVAAMTGHERVTFCNTGSEAVMAAMRVARTVTGRDRIVVFGNDYHGQFDEVLVKGRNRGGTPVALPVAAGIPAASVTNMTVLRYGDAESLDWIRANAGEIAAVIIEPVQSRHPELRPEAFVRSLREIATTSEFALVFDEVVTGFRVDPGGMQAIWGIKGDMATYGKVVGGGMPIGLLVGDSRFMDALDGGHWNYGDDSVPTTAPTFCAGTFVRHPVVLAAARAVLQHIKGDGAALYGRVAERTEGLVAEVNADLARRGIPNVVQSYKSWFVTDFGRDDPLGALIYAKMRMLGIHIQDGYPCFLTTAHSEADFQAIAAAFRESLDAFQAVGIFGTPSAEVASPPQTSIPRAARVSTAPLTEAQKEIWLAAQAGDGASCAFNESFTMTIDGPLDEDKLRQALKTVVARHDALQIRFGRAGDHFEFIPDFDLDVGGADLLGDTDREALFARFVEDEARTPFDLAEGPLARACILRMEPQSHRLVFTAHHIVCDGWSVNVLVEELASAYSALVRGATPDLPAALSYATYATELAPKTEMSNATERFWLDQFAEVPDLPDLPLDRPRPERRNFSGGTVHGQIGADAYKALKKAGARAGATLFSTLLAALQVVIARLSGQDDIVVAVPSAGQSLLGGQTLVGHCVNLLPLRQRVDAGMRFDAHLKATQQLVINAFEHQDYTYGTLVRKLNIKRDMHRLPLTEIQFNLERVPENLHFGGLETRIASNGKAFSNFDMFFNLTEGPQGVRIDVDYNAEVFDRATVERWIGHLVTLVEALAEDIAKPIDELPLMRASEKNWLVHTLNDSAADYDRDAFVFSLFADKVKAQPHAVAVEHDGQALTYTELDRRSDQLAAYIQKVVPNPGLRIAVLVERSLEMVVALLAIMKSGHAYVPLDPAHPENRLTQTLEIARVAAIICDSEKSAGLAGPQLPAIRLDTDADAIAAVRRAPKLPADTAAAAYVIFTSGSTGAPKGVEVSHRALVNFLVSMEKEPGLTDRDTIVAVTTISFDIAGLELYLPLITGGRVVLAGRQAVRDGFALVRLVEQCNATVLQATPTLWQMLVEAGLKRPGLKMLCGGEPLPKALAETLLATGGELWNMYGPTETTIWSSVGKVDTVDRPITIGHPIANTQLHILDQTGRIAAIGITGELHIGGEGLANGYFDRPDLTEKAFVEIDIGTGASQRLYRTGDVGRRLADGTLQLLGRRDQQIKLRGFRIELGDIEAVMARAPGIRQCAVVAAQNGRGEKHLVCYLVAEEGGSPPSNAQLSSHAESNLPAHMVPTFWAFDEALPQTANGKLDRKALEQRGLPQRAATVIRVPPRTPMEERLCTIWREVLNSDDIGVEDNLYALGADSLVIFRIAARMLDSGLELEAKHLMMHPSVAELAAFAEARNEVDATLPHPNVPSLRDFRNGARRPIEQVTRA